MSQRVGYTGGDSEEPTYGSVCGGDGHTEAVKIEFDPNVISYEQLLDTFWAEHNPSGYKPKVQYKSAIWPQNKAQEAAARASKKPRLCSGGTFIARVPCFVGAVARLSGTNMFCEYENCPVRGTN